MSTHVQTKVVLVRFQILMNVQQIRIIAMSMPIAATPKVLSSAPAILVILETGLYVKVILDCSFNVCHSLSLCITSAFPIHSTLSGFVRVLKVLLFLREVP